MAIRERLYTVDEFWEIISRPENADRKFELVNGEIVENMPTEEHGSVTTDLITFLNVYVKKHMLGRVVNEVSYKNPADVYNNRIPDISFTRTERLKPLVTQGASTQMPDLVIEVRSPGNTRKGLQEKAVYFIQNGVLLVWIVYPQEKLVEVYRPGQPMEIFGIEDTLDGEAVLPGFKLALRELFGGEE
jgi:Uma2 family endonuclease